MPELAQHHLFDIIKPKKTLLGAKQWPFFTIAMFMTRTPVDCVK